MKNILVLSDGRPGHYNQSLAVAEAIKQSEPLSDVTLMEVKVKKNRKYLLRLLLNCNWGRKWLKEHMTPVKIAWFYEGYNYKKSPDIVVSAGKDTSMLNALLGMMYDAKTLFVGHPKKLDHDLFSAVLTVLDLGFENQILLDVAPTTISLVEPEKRSSALLELGLDENAHYKVLLIGGNGSGYIYDSEDIKNLIEGVNKENENWLVTTSRRTDILFEEKMKKMMNASYFVDYNKEPQRIMKNFLLVAEIVYVTEESASMVSEAIASGKPVVTLRPTKSNPDTNYQKILEKFEKEKRIVRISIEEMKSFKVDMENFHLLQQSSLDELRYKLKEVLNG